MRSIPVDTQGAMALMAVLPEVKVKDRKTGEISMDVESGAPMMTLSVTFILNGEANILQLSVPQPGVPEGLTLGMPVALTGLIARPWENNFNGQARHGIAFRAVAVTSLAG